MVILSLSQQFEISIFVNIFKLHSMLMELYMRIIL